MPYISQHHRQTLDPLIDKLASQIVQQAQTMDYDGAFAGKSRDNSRMVNFTFAILIRF